MDTTLKFILAFIAGIFSSTGLILLINSLLSLLPSPILFQVLFGFIFLSIGGLIAVVIKDR